MEQLIEYGMQIAATLLITLIGVLGAYLSAKLGKSANLQNIDTAQKEVIRAAELTVGELQQTLVDGLKAASEDGKLTDDEISSLKQQLLDKTIEKISAPAYTLLQAAAVDVEALITGAGESWIERIKSNQAA
ncbi:MAG TPA: hypothetical protein P5075_01525 [Eubacteriales bacterium]|nr:hypothetical protein [Eubacteriales bacterium]